MSVVSVKASDVCGRQTDGYHRHTKPTTNYAGRGLISYWTIETD